jgi:hypothetical protein
VGASDQTRFEDWPVLVLLVIAGVLTLGLAGVATWRVLDYLDVF